MAVVNIRRKPLRLTRDHVLVIRQIGRGVKDERLLSFNAVRTMSNMGLVCRKNGFCTLTRDGLEALSQIKRGIK